MEVPGKEIANKFIDTLEDTNSAVKYQVSRAGAAFAIRRGLDFTTTMFESFISNTSLFVTGTIGSVLKMVMGPEIARNMGWIASAIGGKMAGILAIGGAAGVSAAFKQVDYLHEQHAICDFYRDTIAKQVHKDAKDVTTDDMKMAAEHNPVIEEELQRAKRRRNFGIPVAMVTTLAAFAMVTMVLPAAVAALGAAPLAGVGGFLVKAAVSMMTYYSVKTPLNALGAKYFGTHQPTASDKIHEICRAQRLGKTIEPEMVLAAFAKSDQELKHAIIDEYGKPYDDLSAKTKEIVLQQAEKDFPLKVVTQAINERKIKPQAIANVAAIRNEWDEQKHQSLLESFKHSIGFETHERTSTRFQDKVGRNEQAESFVQRMSESLQRHTGPVIE